MDWETRMDDTYELCRALDALEHARQVMAFHAQGYRQVATLAGLALERIEAVRGSQNWVQLQETLHEVETLLTSILLQATERGETSWSAPTAMETVISVMAQGAWAGYFPSRPPEKSLQF